MYESNDGHQEPSAVQRHENDGCSVFRALILAVERHALGDVAVSLCGHRVGDTIARNFPYTVVDT